MNIEQAKEFYETHYPNHFNWLDANAGFIRDGVADALNAFAQQCVEAERERIRAGIKPMKGYDILKDSALNKVLEIIDGEAK